MCRTATLQTSMSNWVTVRGPSARNWPDWVSSRHKPRSEPLHWVMIMNWPLLVPAGLLGLALLIAGYPLFRILLVLTGAYFGFVYGPEILTAFGLQPGPMLAWLLAVATAVLLALVAWQLFGMALFLWGFFTGYGLGLALV